MRTYEVTLTGKTPLLMHSDNIEWADAMDAWKLNPDNKKNSKAGDDRTPAYRWIGSLYHDDEVLAIPSDNIMRCLMEGGTMVLVPGGKSGKTFKAQTQSGCMSEEAYWPLKVGGKTVAIDPIMDLESEPDFGKHRAYAAANGFELYMKRAKIGSSKHLRVRPRFNHWSATGRLVILDDQLTEQVLRDILRFAGQYKGLCDWRPSSRTPGPFGMFSAEIKEV